MLGKNLDNDLLLASMRRSELLNELERFLTKDRKENKTKWMELDINKLKQWGFFLHGNLYDYSKLRIEDKKLVLWCRRCEEEFTVEFSHHYGNKRTGCSKCGKHRMADKNRKPKPYNTERKISKFLEQARAAHGDLYNYSQVRWQGVTTPVTVICRWHGPFEVKPCNHYRGSGCPKCKAAEKKKRIRYTQEEVIQKVREKFGDKYAFVESAETVSKNSFITLKCSKHGEFRRKYYSLALGKGCPNCSLNGNVTKNDHFIQDARERLGPNIDLSKVNYTGLREKVTLICPEHGEYRVRAITIYNGGGHCISCKRKNLKGDVEHESS